MKARSFRGTGFPFATAVEKIQVFHERQICFRRDSASTRESKNTEDSESKYDLMVEPQKLNQKSDRNF